MQEKGSPHSLPDCGSQDGMGDTGKNTEFLQLSNNFVNSEEPVLPQRGIKCEFTREVLEKNSPTPLPSD